MSWHFASHPQRQPIAVFLAGAIAANLIALAAATSASAQSCVPESWKSWKVEPKFKGDKARTNLRGAACDLAAAPQQCIAVNDQKTYAQRFAIAGTTLVPGDPVDLIDGDDDPDAESGAFAGDSFYVAGSHGNSRKSNDPNDVSYVVVRIDAKTGKLDRSGKWRAAIFASNKLGKYAGQPLKDGGPDKGGGANAEGMAVWNDTMYLGFRGPSIGTNALILGAPLSEVFSDPGKPLVASDFEIGLGARAGIRDLAAVRTGLLVLSGPVNDEAVTPAISHWNPATGKLDKLAELPSLPAGAKAETLLVLKDEKDEDHYQVLLIFEGPANGAPVECSVKKPK
jgi:hypothetical protein